MTRVSCDSWNVLFCLENMVFLVLVSVNVELGGGYLRIFPLYSEKYNGGIGMGDEIIAAFVGDRSFVTCDRLNKHPFMNSCF